MGVTPLSHEKSFLNRAQSFSPLRGSMRGIHNFVAVLDSVKRKEVVDIGEIAQHRPGPAFVDYCSRGLSMD